MFDIQEELKKLPAKPGVYLMHNSKDEIIYVGKAIKLCNCLLYTSDAADEEDSVDLGGCRIIKKKKNEKRQYIP